jgi:hypothetical protein
MPWVRFDDQFPVNRKVRGLSDKAFRLYVSALCWCNANLTDGVITAAELRYVSDISSPKRYARELVDAKLWEEIDETGGGWYVHDYLEFQPSAEKIKGERVSKRARQERWADRKRQERDASSDASQDAIEGPSEDAAPIPIPSRPIPTQKNKSSYQSPTAPYFANLTDDDQDFSAIDEKITRLLATLTPDPITSQHTAWVRQTILSKARGQIRDRIAYVSRAIQQDPRPYLPQQPTTAAAAAGRCVEHFQSLPCIGCAANRKARKDEP